MPKRTGGLTLQKGFTLIELIIALLLTSLVFIGIIYVATAMVSAQFNEVAKGGVSGMTLYSLDQMNRELQNASYLATPSGAAYSSVISGCTDWSNAGGTNNPLDGNSSNVGSFYYCVNANSLWRYAQTGVCTPLVAPNGACGAASAKCAAGNTSCTANAVVFNSFYVGSWGGGNYFQRTGATSVLGNGGGVELNYAVGNPNPTTSTPVPITYSFDVQIGMNKSINSPD